MITADSKNQPEMKLSDKKTPPPRPPTKQPSSPRPINEGFGQDSRTGANKSGTSKPSPISGFGTAPANPDKGGGKKK